MLKMTSDLDVSSRRPLGLHRIIQLHLLWHRLGHRPNIEWVALEMNRDYTVIFEITHKYCILDTFVDYESYSISSDGFLPTVVDIMVI